MKARLHDISVTLDGKTLLTIEAPESCRTLWDELREHDVDVSIKRFRKRRSLDANAYAWVLISKLAEKTGEKKAAVYQNEIREVGGACQVVCVQDKAVDALRDGWSRNGLGWVTDVIPSKIKGCTNVILYFGSSIFDSAQMATFIDHIIQDCKAVGIETMPPDELEALLGAWT